MEMLAYLKSASKFTRCHVEIMGKEGLSATLIDESVNLSIF